MERKTLLFAIVLVLMCLVFSGEGGEPTQTRTRSQSEMEKEGGKRKIQGTKDKVKEVNVGKKRRVDITTIERTL